MINAEAQKASRQNWLINLISVVVPLVVAALLAIPNKLDLGAWTKILPHFIGGINTLTTLALIAGLIFIKKGKVRWHQTMMTTAFALGVLFLICYVTYHATNPATRYNGMGALRYFYLFVLLTHILLSLVVLPLVLRAMWFAVTNQFASHVKTVKFAYPIWLYVSVTGVIVYLMAYHLQNF